ncbi:LPXTG cell wall anchor domain-containing protein [Corynebacterium urinipleomorphum]|uniref:LPXTG cell wall anchor domain-containing protein n=1 Tax=Corynebacterium urinipleomorphum TaxID=1852380 RepID=UPI0038B23A82
MRRGEATATCSPQRCERKDRDGRGAPDAGGSTNGRTPGGGSDNGAPDTGGGKRSRDLASTGAAVIGVTILGALFILLGFLLRRRRDDEDDNG